MSLIQFGRQIEGMNFEPALQGAMKFEGVLPGLAKAGEEATRGIVDIGAASKALKRDIGRVESAMGQLAGQFATGLISKATFKENIASLKAVRSESLFVVQQ